MEEERLRARTRSRTSSVPKSGNERTVGQKSPGERKIKTVFLLQPLGNNTRRKARVPPGTGDRLASWLKARATCLIKTLGRD